MTVRQTGLEGVRGGLYRPPRPDPYTGRARGTAMAAWRITPGACLGTVALAVAALLAAPPGRCDGPLPAAAGQVWQEHDIRPFTAAAGPGSERHVVDWILQDTGYSTWHGGIVAALSADATAVRCFHQPPVQERVGETVARFVAGAAAPHRFAIRVVGVKDPGWRVTLRGLLQPIPAATPGVQAWIASREEAAVVLGTLRKRPDFAELPTGPVLAANGVPAVVSGGRSRPYLRDLTPRPEVWPGWQPLSASCDEGFSIDVQPLLSTDMAGVEAVIRCRIDQVERMAPLPVAVGGTGQRVELEVPQLAAVRVGERMRWPAGRVLVVGLGLVPWPVPGQNDAPVVTAVAPRTDVVVFIEPRLRDPG